MCDLPESERHQASRGRLTMLGCRTDDGGAYALVVVNEADGSWSFHGPSAARQDE